MLAASYVALAASGAASLVACAGAEPAGSAHDGVTPAEPTAPAAGAGTPRPPPAFARSIPELEAKLAAAGVPGASLAIIVDGATSYATGIGVKGKGSEDPVTTSTRFRIGSMTKALTAATLLSFVDAGEVDLDAPVSTYVPYLRLKPASNLGALRVRHLIGNTAGLADSYAVSCPSDPGASEEWGRTTVIDSWSPPGRFYNYSNTNFAVAGLVIEAVAGRAYPEVVKERVFDRLGMASSTFDVASTRSADHSHGRMPERPAGQEADLLKDTAALEGIGPTTVWADVDPTSADCARLRPGGLAFSTASDYAKFVEALIAGGGKSLSPASAAAMQHPAAETDVLGVSYGFGEQVVTVAGERLVLHAGAVDGFSAVHVFAPGRRVGLVLLLNQVGGVDPTTLALSMLVEALGLRVSPGPDPRPPPSTWSVYAGAYHDPFVFGAVEVRLHDGGLFARVGAEPGEAPMTPAGGDVFSFRYRGVTTPVRFVRPAGGAGSPEYFATRYGVARRSE